MQVMPSFHSHVKTWDPRYIFFFFKTKLCNNRILQPILTPSNMAVGLLVKIRYELTTKLQHIDQSAFFLHFWLSKKRLHLLRMRMTGSSIFLSFLLLLPLFLIISSLFSLLWLGSLKGKKIEGFDNSYSQEYNDKTIFYLFSLNTWPSCGPSSLSAILKIW